MDQDDIDRELFELARDWMEVSNLKKLPGHVAKETDVALCKQLREFPKQKGAILVRLFRCPLSMIEAPMWIFGRNPQHGGRRLDAARSMLREQCKQSR